MTVTPWVPQKACKNATQIPTGLDKLLDSWYKNFASCWLWRVLETNKALLASDSYIRGHHDKYHMEAMEKAFNKVIQWGKTYENALQRKDKDAARRSAKELAETAQTYLALERDSQTLAQKIAGSRIELSQMPETPKGYKMILARRDFDSKILVGKQYAQNCNVGYREDAFTALTEWFNNAFRQPLDAGSDKRIFWIHGERDCGKSVIAHYLAKKCEEQGILTAGYLFHDNFGPASMPKLTANLAEDLMEFLGIGFQLQLQRYCKDNNVDANEFFKHPMEMQFRKLLLPAWKGLTNLEKKPMLIVLDEVDRCQPWAITQICDFIKVTISPQNCLPIYYVVSSCRDPVLVDQFERAAGLAGRVLQLSLPRYDPEGFKAPRQPQNENREGQARAPAFGRSTVSLSLRDREDNKEIEAPEPTPTSDDGGRTPRANEFHHQQQASHEVEDKIALDPYTMTGALLVSDHHLDWEMDLGVQQLPDMS